MRGRQRRAARERRSAEPAKVLVLLRLNPHRHPIHNDPMSAGLYIFSVSALLVLVGLSRVRFVYHYKPQRKRSGLPVRRRSASGASRGTGQSHTPKLAVLPERKTPQGPKASAEDGSTHKDLVSALLNLGCSRQKAQDIASRVISQGPADFNSLLMRALREAA